MLQMPYIVHLFWANFYALYPTTFPPLIFTTNHFRDKRIEPQRT